jgi:hypothetical protein
MALKSAEIAFITLLKSKPSPLCSQQKKQLEMAFKAFLEQGANSASRKADLR